MSPRVLYGVTAPNTALAFLDGQLRAVTEAGMATHLMCPETDIGSVAVMAARNGTEFHPMAVSRNPSPREDLAALAAVFRVVRRVQPDAVVAGTPKMSLLMLIAAFILRVPHRIYLCHGLRLEGFQGRKRTILSKLERLLARLSTQIVAVSPSVRTGLMDIGVSRPIDVLGHGSPNGIDITRFSVASVQERMQAREQFGVGPEQSVASFVGRLTRDKGIATLLTCAQDLPQVTFLVAGTEEPADDRDREVLAALRDMRNVSLLGRVSNTPALYAASDVLVLPTKREGLPTVVLEASAAGVPTVAYRATGTVDAVIPGVTGTLVPAGDARAFSQELERLLADRARLDALRKSAHRHVKAHFANAVVWNHWVDYLKRVTG